MKKLSLLIAFAIYVVSASAQGQIEGKVTDQATGESLLFATITVMQGSSVVAGIDTDLNGFYRIKNLKPGKYNVQANYIGYQLSQIKDVIVQGDTTTIVNFELTQGVMLEEVELVEYEIPLFNRSSKWKNISTRNINSTIATSGGLNKSKKNLKNNTSEEYETIVENPYISPLDAALSTFSIDVDRASYSNVRRFLNNHRLPPADAVRIEEMINYFHYDLPEPQGNHPFQISTEYGPHPWIDGAGMLRVSLQGKKSRGDYVGSNLVFLLDVSGSMNSENKLPLLKRSFHLLLDQLEEEDKVSIVVYAGAAGCVLEPTEVKNRSTILNAIHRLQSGGSTAGAEGIQLAYDLARDHFIEGGNNRVILATDGDFNVGISSKDGLEQLIKKRRDDGIFLTVLGFGMGNYKDARLETLADKGNGNYAYIDNIREAQKVFGEELNGTLFTIAKDVKIQIEFNPAYVQAYRLVGYENRLLDKEDFNNDKKDAGELGSGHQVTALYEIIPTDSEVKWVGDVDPLKYQQTKTAAKLMKNGELCTVKLRYKKPREKNSIYQDLVVSSRMQEKVSENTLLAAGIASWGMKLRESQYLDGVSYEKIYDLLSAVNLPDKYGRHEELLQLVKSSQLLTQTQENYRGTE